GPVSVTVAAASSDIAAAKTSNPTSGVAPGAELTYTIAATNTGPSDAGTTTLTDTVPPQTTFLRLTRGTWDCGATTPTIGVSGQTVTCTIPSLSTGASSSILTLVVKANTSAAGTVSNTATAFSTTADPAGALGNNAQTVATTVGPASADLATSKSASPSANVTPGTELTYTIGVTNNGPSNAGTVTLTDV